MGKAERIVLPITSQGNFIKAQADRTINELKSYMKGPASRMLKGDLEQTVSGWTHKPQMVAEYSEPYRVNMEVYAHPKGRYYLNWQRVSGGTKARIIRSSKGMMVFRRDYTPHTTPQGSYGGPGTKSGDTIRAWEVGHKKRHEIKPREFSKKIVVRRKTKLVNDMTRIVNKAWSK